MIDLKKVKLPDTIEVDGSFFDVHTDFQFWITFGFMLQNKALVTDFDFIYSGRKPSLKDKLPAFEELIKFYAPERELPKNIGADSGIRCLDYELDSDLIYSAFYENYKIDLLDENLHLHWYKFLALLAGIHDTKLSEVIGYRAYNPNKKSDYKKDMLQLQRAWALPIIMSEEEKEALNKFDELFS